VKDTYTHYGAPHSVLHERNFPHHLKADVWMWSVFSEEKDLDFNGYLIQTSDNQSFIVDPPCAGPDVLNGFTPLPKVEFIFLTNADHERASVDFRERLGIPIYIHEADASLLSLKPDFTVQDGHELANGWQVIHLPNQKTPGETALYHLQQRTLILGDALIGKPFQKLSLLPSEKYRDRHAALSTLHERLSGLDVQVLLLGDGDPIMLNAGSTLKDTLIEHRR